MVPVPVFRYLVVGFFEIHDWDYNNKPAGKGGFVGILFLGYFRTEEPGPAGRGSRGG